MSLMKMRSSRQVLQTILQLAAAINSQEKFQLNSGGEVVKESSTCDETYAESVCKAIQLAIKRDICDFATDDPTPTH